MPAKAPLPKVMDWSALGNQSRLFGAGQTEIMADRGAGRIVETTRLSAVSTDEATQMKPGKRMLLECACCCGERLPLRKIRKQPDWSAVATAVVGNPSAVSPILRV
jgi:hypothetical protein